jgi:hypothetical protein
MARMKLSSMSVETLLQLRDDISRMLSGKVSELQRQLAALGEDAGAGRGRGGCDAKVDGRGAQGRQDPRRLSDRQVRCGVKARSVR